MGEHSCLFTMQTYRVILPTKKSNLTVPPLDWVVTELSAVVGGSVIGGSVVGPEVAAVDEKVRA